MSRLTNNPFPPNAREKVLYVKMTRSPGGKQYTIERVKQLNVENQYSTSTTQLNKREWTREFRNAEVTVS